MVAECEGVRTFRAMTTPRPHARAVLMLCTLSTLLVAACDRLPTDPVSVDELSCNNIPTPLRFLVERAAVRDTTPTVNRHAIPHRWADTVRLARTATSPGLLVINAHGGRCTTLLDSLIIYAPTAWQYVEAA